MNDRDASVEAVVAFVRSQQDPLSQSEIAERLSGPETHRHPNLGEIQVFAGSLGEFWLASATQRVIKYSAPPRFTPTEAKEHARAFLRERIPEFEIRNFVQTKGEMRDPLWIEEYREEPKAAEISIFENWIVVQIHLERRSVHYFNASNLRHVRTTRPEIDEATAREIALRSNSDDTIEDLRLMEHTSDGGRTFQTIWHVTLSPAEPDSPLRLLSLDADTGQEVPQ